MNTLMSPTDPALDWQQRLNLVVATMREMSRQTDPLVMGQAYAARMRQLLPIDRVVSLSRRNLAAPQFRVTRCSDWTQTVNPWKDRHKLPLLSGGLLADLIYGDEPQLFDDLMIDPDDPAAEYLAGMRSLMAVPHYDQGEGLNMVVLMREPPHAFEQESLPEHVWMSNLFGRATHNLVLSQDLREAYEAVDHELRIVAEIQQSLLPAELPTIPTMSLAAHYQMARRAGGDYYDFFELPEGRWGILIADVSGHGTPAAVLMAILHSIAHSYPGPPSPPGELLRHVNDRLAARYTLAGTFVTAYYAIYDPANRSLTYASAGHPPPRLKRCNDGSLLSLDGTRGLPLGILAGEHYTEVTRTLEPGDQIVFYTDGITEAENPRGEPFGTEQLDRVLANCSVRASDLLRATLDALDSFTEGRPAVDDQTVLVAKVS